VTEIDGTPLDRLSGSDLEVVRECLTAAVHGPFFPEWEFHTIFGLERDDVAEVLDRWPETANPEGQDLAVKDALNNLLGYPHGQEQAWREFISAQPSEVAAVLARWRGENAWDPSPRGHFDRME